MVYMCVVLQCAGSGSTVPVCWTWPLFHVLVDAGTDMVYMCVVLQCASSGSTVPVCWTWRLFHVLVDAGTDMVYMCVVLQCAGRRRCFWHLWRIVLMWSESLTGLLRLFLCAVQLQCYGMDRWRVLMCNRQPMRLFHGMVVTCAFGRC